MPSHKIARATKALLAPEMDEEDDPVLKRVIAADAAAENHSYLSTAQYFDHGCPFSIPVGTMIYASGR